MMGSRGGMVAVLAMAAGLVASSPEAQAPQSLQPVAVSGFTFDAFAESLPAAASTDGALDAPYNENVLLADGSPGSLPAGGLVTATNRAYQLADYATPNAVPIALNGAVILSLATPAHFEQLSLLGLSTQDPSQISVEVQFEGGLSQPAVSGMLSDWSESSGAVGGDFARVSRADDAVQTPYRLFALDIPIRPEDQGRRVTAVRIANATPYGFARANILAVSGVAAAPAPVPTLGEWATLLLAVLIGLGGMIIVRRRSQAI